MQYEDVGWGGSCASLYSCDCCRDNTKVPGKLMVSYQACLRFDLHKVHAELAF